MFDKYILALETSSSICGASIIHKGKLVSIEEKDVKRQHAELLPDITKKTLNNIEMNLDDIDAIAINIGPGSFTGLRVGLGFAKGLAYSKSLPIIPIPSMLSLAFSLRKYEPQQGMLLSHGEKIFFQTFKWKNNLPSLNKEVCLGNINNYIQYFSNGFHYNCENILFGFKEIRAAKHSSSNIGELASIYYEDFVVYKPQTLVPNYIASFKTGT